MARQSSAKAPTPVRIWSGPLNNIEYVKNCRNPQSLLEGNFDFFQNTMYCKILYFQLYFQKHEFQNFLFLLRGFFTKLSNFSSCENSLPEVITSQGIMLTFQKVF